MHDNRNVLDAIDCTLKMLTVIPFMLWIYLTTFF